MFEDVVVLSANTYDFVDKETNRKLNGVTVWVLPINQRDSKVNGVKPVKYSLPIESIENFETDLLPAFAKMHFTMDFSRSKVVPKNFSDFKTIESLKHGK